MSGPSRFNQYLRGDRDVRKLAAAARNADAPPRSPGGLLADLRATWRMLRSYVRGEYRAVRLRSILAVMCGVAYFVSPIDLLPDLFVPLGFTDDAVVVALVVAVLRRELAGFRAWETGRASRAAPRLPVVPS